MSVLQLFMPAWSLKSKERQVKAAGLSVGMYQDRSSPQVCITCESPKRILVKVHGRLQSSVEHLLSRPETNRMRSRGWSMVSSLLSRGPELKSQVEQYQRKLSLRP